ncbi:unnamed protein product [Rhizophagus irregularis]|nr:unnamed protein product [Rhizophagus irregularis]
MQNELQSVSEDCVQLIELCTGVTFKEYTGQLYTKDEVRATITGQDLAFSLDMSPHILVEPSLARERLTSVVLNDSEVLSQKSRSRKASQGVGAGVKA